MLHDIRIRGIVGWAEMPATEPPDGTPEPTPESTPESTPKVGIAGAERGGFAVQWLAQEGVGEIEVTMGEGGIEIHAETLGEDSIRAILAAIVTEGRVIS